jgi:hypothetical protein
MDDDSFIASFESGTLPEACLRHADHIRLGWLYLTRKPLLAALETMSTGLRAFATRLGKADRYHATITWAYMFLINERMKRLDPSVAWGQFADTNKDLLAYRPGILSTYYRPETLASPIARSAFVLPDRLAQ